MLNSDVIKSLYSLAKYDGGMFKSEKQASFISSFANDNVIYHQEVYTFGEYEGRTDKNTKILNTMFLLDSQGIKEITKLNSKGESKTTFKRDQNSMAKSEENKKKLEEKKKATLKSNELRDKAFKLQDRISELTLAFGTKNNKISILLNDLLMSGDNEEIMYRFKRIYGLTKNHVKRLTIKNERLFKEWHNSCR